MEDQLEASVVVLAAQTRFSAKPTNQAEDPAHVLTSLEPPLRNVAPGDEPVLSPTVAPPNV